MAYLSPQTRIEVMERSDFCCTFCRVPQFATGYRDRDGEFVPVLPIRGTACLGGWKSDNPIIKIVLTVAKADEQTLVALCQRCNNRMAHGLDYEKVERYEPEKVKKTKEKPETGQISLFT